MRLAPPRLVPIALTLSLVLAACGQSALPISNKLATLKTLSVSNGTYEIVNVNSGKLLDVSGISRDDGARVHQWTRTGNTNQHWKLTYQGDDSFEIQSVNSGKALDVGGASQSDGADVLQWTYWGGANQKWKFGDLGGGNFKIESINSGKVLDVEGYGTNDGARVHQWTYWGGGNQQWKLVPLEGSNSTPVPTPVPTTPPTPIAPPVSSPTPDPILPPVRPPVEAAPLDPAFSDSWLTANEAFPEGVPSYYSWYRNAAQPGWMNNPPLDWFALTNWGQVYAEEGYHPDASNTRVQIRNVGTWIKSRSTGRWSQVQFSVNPEGGAFNSDFANNGGRGGHRVVNISAVPKYDSIRSLLLSP